MTEGEGRPLPSAVIALRLDVVLLSCCLCFGLFSHTLPSGVIFIGELSSIPFFICCFSKGFSGHILHA
jgi:hypothetical protein